MIKHVGKHGDRKVAIVFREVPGEEHMALVVYPDIMPRHLHDSLMAAIETPESQAASQLGDAIHGRMFSDGRPMLAALHTEGMLKKVRTESIIMSPGGKTTIRLDELNKLVREMESGEEARQKLEKADANAGYTGTVNQKDDMGRSVQRNVPTPPPATNGALDDTAIAANLKTQAERMAAEAKGLLAESERMMKEAAEMLGEPAPKATKAPAKRSTAKKTTAPKTATPKTTAERSRPKASSTSTTSPAASK